MSEKETNQYATKEWQTRTARNAFDVSEEEANWMYDSGLLGEKAPTLTEIAKHVSAGKLSEKTAEKLLRGVFRIPLKVETPMPRLQTIGGQEYIAMPGPAAKQMPELPSVEGLAEKHDAAEKKPAHYLENALRAKPYPGIKNIFEYPMSNAVMRPLRCPIFDTIQVPMSGRLDVHAFADSKWFPDHTQKDPKLDCNLTVNGSLGMPTEFDLYFLEIVFEKFANPEDVRRVMRSMSLVWYFGQNIRWLTTTLSQFTPSFSYEDLDGQQKETVDKALVRFGREGVWTSYRHDMTTPDGRPRRISSTENFRCHIEGNAGELYAPVRMKIKMQDTLYVPI